MNLVRLSGGLLVKSEYCTYFNIQNMSATEPAACIPAINVSQGILTIKESYYSLQEDHHPLQVFFLMGPSITNNCMAYNVIPSHYKQTTGNRTKCESSRWDEEIVLLN
ncbi:Uncharacterized protein APZ42_022777 [Daphnia magna]|uniref:Uncharacterized protein n=1 Tax=Daphnia magna TaxID=35525 RepID=A0A164VS67_9CRUS|nr:Uncharacterized protein APZ42_022777 [Daphnia magna]